MGMAKFQAEKAELLSQIVSDVPHCSGNGHCLCDGSSLTGLAVVQGGLTEQLEEERQNNAQLT